MRQVAQARDVELLAPDRAVFVDARTGDQTDYESVAPSAIVRVGDLYVVLPADEEDDWLMGQADDDGTIICWTYHGPLEEALRAL